MITSITARQALQREVELEHVHRGLAQEAELRALDMILDELADDVF